MTHMYNNTRCVWVGGGKGTITSLWLSWAIGRPGDLWQTATLRWLWPCKILAPRRRPAGDGARELTTPPPRLDWVASQIAVWRLWFVFPGTRCLSAPGSHLVGPGDILPTRT